MKPLLSALIVLAGCASAAAGPDKTPSAPPPPPAPSCKATGDVVFEIDDLVDKQPTAKVKQLYATGAWTLQVTDDAGKQAPPTSGCLAKDQLDKIRANLKAMTWKVHHNRIHCMAVSPNYTVYKADGKPMWTQHVCSSDALDEDTQKKLDEITDILK